jgi:hypothetical protein
VFVSLEFPLATSAVAIVCPRAQNSEVYRSVDLAALAELLRWVRAHPSQAARVRGVSARRVALVISISLVFAAAERTTCIYSKLAAAVHLLLRTISEKLTHARAPTPTVNGGNCAGVIGVAAVFSV